MRCQKALIKEGPSAGPDAGEDAFGVDVGRLTESKYQADVLRDLFRTPFRPPPVVNPSWLHGNDGTITKMAQAIYEERQFTELPILADGPRRLKAAVEVLRLAQLPEGWQQAGPIEAEAIVRQVVKARRAAAPGLLDELADQGKTLLPFEERMANTWRELEERANEPDDEDAEAPEVV
jgi:hypothetical protein